MTESLRGRGVAVFGTLAAILSAVAIVGVFYVAPEDADQGIRQKIFYFHVPIANVSLIAFGVAFVAGILYLRRRDRRYDEVASAAIGLGLLFALLTVVTGAIWAKSSWGVWWQWGDPRLVTYLIIILIYVAYFVLRTSLDGERRLRYSAIYAMVAFASVPLSYYSVRVASSFVHPVVFTQRGANLPWSMLVWFVVAQVAMILGFVALLQLELAQRRAESSLRRLRTALEGR